jgi:SpoVG
MWKENRFGWPLRGIIWFTVAIAASCAVIALLAGYVQKARSLEKVTRRIEWSGKSESCKDPTGLFVAFPSKKQRDGSDRQLAYPANAETRNLFQRVILAEYEKIVGDNDLEKPA